MFSTLRPTGLLIPVLSVAIVLCQAACQDSQDAQAPDAQAPDAQAPDAQAPDAQAPDAQAPDATVPALTIKRTSFYNLGLSAQRYAETSDMIVVDGNVAGSASDYVSQLRAYNPDVSVVVYFNTRGLLTNENIGGSLETLFKTNDWLLKNASGDYVHKKDGNGNPIPSYYYIDVGNSDYQQWLADWYNHFIADHGTDGAYLDNWSVSTLCFYSADSTPVNPRTGSGWSDAQMRDAYKSLTLKIRSVIGSDRPVFCNGIFDPTRWYWEGYQAMYEDALLNGAVTDLCLEAWVSNRDSSDWYTEAHWKQGIDMYVSLTSAFPSLGLHPIADNAGWIYPIEGTSLPPGATAEQYATYCYASLLLSIESAADNYLCFGSYGNGYGIADFDETDSPQRLFQTNIGTPAAAYETTLAHIYVREYTDGKVLVNPTETVYTVTVGDGYVDATTAEPVPSEVAMPPHTGLILGQ